MRHTSRQQSGLVFLILIIPLLLCAGYIFFAWKWSYSEGERAGFVQKLSKKGYVCKTWEGELSMVALPGAAAEKFLFTVWDDKVAAEINAQFGKKVALFYEEKVGLPTSCFGDTRHYVTKVKSLETPVAAPVVAPAVAAQPTAQPASALPTPTPPISVQNASTNSAAPAAPR